MERTGGVGIGIAGGARFGKVRYGRVRQANFMGIDMENMKAERKFLEQLAKQHGGMLMVEDVLGVARDPRCILHKHFQWDDTKAAEAFRRMQARQLIQKCTVTIEKAPDIPIRAFVSLSSDQYSGGGYRMTADVLSDDDLRNQLFQEMVYTISKWKTQLSLMDKETAAIVDMLDEIVVRKTKGKRKEARA
jgi:hypothetical protein